MSDLIERLRNALGETYRIERELEGGGMSRVFLAEEPALGRQVVIKVLPPDMAMGVSVERFRREIQVAARLQHPHVVPLLTAGSADGLLYYAMPFIKGESLRAKLAREGELPIPQVVRLLRDVADALAYAHREGVVHRDIKPDNVMLADDHGVVTDFGVAKAVREAQSGSPVTSLGVALGTPAYMAPEQAAGDPNVDHRADVYAFGVLAYEMLTGGVPFTGGTPQAVLSAQITEAPDPVTTHRETVPPGLAELVMRCLAKKPADRWQSAGEVKAQLDLLLTPTGGTAPVREEVGPSSGTRAAIRRAHPLRVTVLFGAASAFALAAVYGVMYALGLPDWVFAGAVILLALGLPIMLLTGREERRRAEARAAGEGSEGARGIGWLLTWRRALGGGVLAFLGLAFLVGGFMSLRALGVGPFGTLLSAGVLEHQDRILLADFENVTDDPRMGETVTELIRIDLAQSPVVSVLETGQVRAVLERMRREAEEVLTTGLAAEVAAREGVKAYVAGEVRQVGEAYVLSARLVAAETGDVLVAVRETASGVGDLVRTADRLSSRLRERIGESLRTVRASPRLERVTTGSLEALRLYAHAERISDLGDEDRAIALLEQAVALDTAFAMAYRRLGAFYGNVGERARADSALIRAHTLRGRLTERERYHVEALHAFQVGGDPERAVTAYLALLERHPLDATALNNLAVIHLILDRPQRAVEVADRAIAARVASAISYTNLIPLRLQAGDLVAADSLIRLFAERFPGNVRIGEVELQLAMARRDFALAERLARDMLAGPPAQRQLAYERLRDLAEIRGRLAEAERYARSALAIEAERRQWSDEVHAARIELDALERAAWFLSEPADVSRRTESLWERWRGLVGERPPQQRAYLRFTWTFLRSGAPDRGRALYDEYAAALGDPRRFVPGIRIPLYEAGAALTLAEGEPAAAIEETRALCSPWIEIVAVCRMSPLVAEAFDAAGRPDSALAQYEGYVAFQALVPPGLGQAERWRYGPSIRRLAELHEEGGDHASAAAYYRRFAELWRDADPPLRALAEDAERRARDLEGGASSR